MAYDITDDSELLIYITDGWRGWYIPKFRIEMVVDEPFIHLYWTDSEKGTSGIRRGLTMDYQDVTFGYISPSSAGEVETEINAMIISAWTNLPSGGYVVTSQTADYNLALTDANSIILCDTVTSLEITIPTNASVAFPIGTRIAINAIDNGLVSVTHAVGVTLQSVDNFTGIIIDGGWAWLTKIGTDSWNLEGDLRIALDADAEAYIDAVVATGVTFTDAEKGYINDFFLELKSESIYTKFYFIYLFLGATAAAHKFNAVNPLDSDAAHRMLFTGSPTHNVNGVTFNGSTQYGDTRFQPSIDMAQDSKNYTVYVKSNGTGFVFGAQNGTPPYAADKLSGNFASGGLVYWGTSGIGDTVTTPSPNTGIFSVNRDTSTNETVKRNDALLDTFATASSNNNTNYMYLGARNFGAGPNSYNACNIAYFSGASELTGAEETVLYNAITTLNTAFGR